jgi:hypothetical protein
MLTRLVEVFGTEKHIQIPGENGVTAEFTVPPKVDPTCLDVREVDVDGEEVLNSPLWDECVNLPSFISKWGGCFCTEDGAAKRRLLTWSEF